MALGEIFPGDECQGSSGAGSGEEGFWSSVWTKLFVTLFHAKMEVHGDERAFDVQILKIDVEGGPQGPLDSMTLVAP